MMRRRRTAFRAKEAASPPGAFTLLEVLIAVSIFTLVAAALYTTFRTGMKAYDTGVRTSELMQRGRFAMDVVTRDLKSAFFLVEAEYNIAYNASRRQVEEARQRFEQGASKWDEVLMRLNDFNRKTVGVELKFEGKSDGESADLSFVRYQQHEGARPLQPMQLARIHYSAKDGALTRSETNVFKGELNDEGEEIQPPEPRPEKLVSGVESFSLKFGFYFDGVWYEDNEWDSSKWEHRRDQTEIFLDDATLQANVANQVTNYRQQGPQDNLPSYIRVRLRLSDPRKKNTPKNFERVIYMVNSLDSHVPLPDTLEAENLENQKIKVAREEILRRIASWEQPGEWFAPPGEDMRKRTR